MAQLRRRTAEPVEERKTLMDEPLDLAPDELRALADRIESRQCTGVSASWCPVHGDCSCPDPLNALDDDRCPLHSPEGSHAEAELARIGR